MNARLLIVVAGCAAMFVLTVMLWIAAPLTQTALHLAARQSGMSPPSPGAGWRRLRPFRLATKHLIVYSILVVGLAALMIHAGTKGQIRPCSRGCF